MLLYISFFVILLKYGECNEDNKIKVYKELPCSTYNADCLMENDCPPYQLIPLKGMCPTQEKYGVKCCRRYDENHPVNRCYGMGGECRRKPNNCPETRIGILGVCSRDEICCIVIPDY